jgi:hypothetical protein
MNSCTQGYECIVVDNTTRSNDLSDCIYWYQANVNLPAFRMGAQVFWDLDANYYQDRTDPDGDDEDPERASTKGARKVKKFVVEKQDKYGIPIVI